MLKELVLTPENARIPQRRLRVEGWLAENSGYL
jgi:hypothetical protein